MADFKGLVQQHMGMLTAAGQAGHMQQQSRALQVDRLAASGMQQPAHNVGSPLAPALSAAASFLQTVAFQVWPIAWHARDKQLQC